LRRALQVLEGEVVIANSEQGFWSTRLSRTYPNPLLVKLARALWQVDPNFSIVGECHWARSGALMRSGIIPHTLDVVGWVHCTLSSGAPFMGLFSLLPFMPVGLFSFPSWGCLASLHGIFLASLHGVV